MAQSSSGWLLNDWPANLAELGLAKGDWLAARSGSRLALARWPLRKTIRYKAEFMAEQIQQQQQQQPSLPDQAPERTELASGRQKPPIH